MNSFIGFKLSFLFSAPSRWRYSCLTVMQIQKYIFYIPFNLHLDAVSAKMESIHS